MAVANTLILAGLIAGGIAGALLLVQSIVARNLIAAALASLLLVAAAAGALIVASWSMPSGAQRPVELVEFALAMAAGPLSAILVGALLRARVPARWLIGPAAAAFVVVALLTGRFGGDPILYAVPIQCLYVAYAWTLLAKANRVIDRRQRAHRQRLLALALLIALSVAVGASLLRLLFSDVALLRPIVPLTISLQFLFLLIASLWLLIRRGTALLVPAEGSAADAGLADRAAERVRSNELYRRADLTVEVVADALGRSPAELAAALSRSEWGGFAAMVQAIRLDCVVEMLRSPDERATSVEAVGMLCGFRSRSALYEAFQRRLGMSPGEFRRQYCPEEPIRTAKQVRRRS